MSEVANWMLIGPGNVGNELSRQLAQEHVAERLELSPLPSYVVRSTGIMGPDGQTLSGYERLEDIDDFPDVTFLAMPSTDDGEIAKGYISTILGKGKIAVTAEKGSISNHFDFLRTKSDNFDRLGINGTVGGGTRMLEVARQYCQDRDNITQIHLSMNGTLSAIMSSVAPPEGTGMSLGQAVHHAVELKYAEPGSETAYDVIRGEAEGDIPKKTAIFFNALGLGEDLIDWHDLQFGLSNEQIAQAVEEAKVRRFIVSMYSSLHLNKAIKCPEEDVIGGFDVEQNGWRIVGGFRHIDRNPLFSHLVTTTGPSNGLVIGLGPDETDGVYSLTGPGAGVRPTANTMIDDYVSRSQIRRDPREVSRA